MNRMFYVAVICLAAVSLREKAVAQPVTETDATCSVFAGAGCAGPGGQGCDSTTFTAPSSGTYYFKVYLQGCSKTTACQCYAAGYVYDSQNNQIDCMHGTCNNCSVPNADTFTLTRGQTYTIYACKVGCGNDCSQFSSACVAYSVLGTSP